MKALITTVDTSRHFSEATNEEVTGDTREAILNAMVAKYGGDPVQVTPTVYKVMEEVNKRAVFVIFVPEEK